MSNFNFIASEWAGLYNKVKKAEQRIYTEPMSAATYCRVVLEECTHLVYDYEYIDKPYNTELVNLLQDEQFKDIVPGRILEGLVYVRKTGNQAVHYGNRVGSKEALVSIKYLYPFIKWFASNYAENDLDIPGAFQESVIPKIGEQNRKQKEIQKEQSKIQEELEKQIAALQAEKEAILLKAQETEETLNSYKDEVEEAKKKISLQKEKRNTKVATEYTEEETREHLIDIDLKEAGWHPLKEGREIEYPVTGMPITADNPKGNGFVDYVLWDDATGKPLAVVEAKRASVDIDNAKEQAKLYANCLEKMFDGHRPIIFYSNGYETKIWEDTLYSTPRRIYGFYTKEELRWLIQKRATVKDIRKAPINLDIAGKGRPYQQNAIRRVAEDFVTQTPEGQLQGAKRRALLVMATGSGKTRTAAALVDVLLKNNWAKRVLFLADRNALVRQAQQSFAEHLKNLSSVDLTREKELSDTRLVFSTYPTMMNKIDNLKNEDGKFYGVGHFDLIIIDEAHRSIYNRYKAIFDYFDSFIVGLTATPKHAIDHNTFEIFGCSNEDPTFLYELGEAVQEGHLVGYKNLNISTDFLKEGIKYKQLSKKDKEKYEDSFEDKTTGLFPEMINKSALNKWLFNKDTVFKVLNTLMEHGLKIEGGDKIGRTIIFAANQDHAKFIVDCFNEEYPNYPAGFISAIHNEVSHAQSLIDSFCDKFKENNPQIAVSVDMMDTGIDAIRVLNLVFFKSVRSYAKFWQMIGRGTRLCPDVFGIGQDKEEFLIIDAGGNFDYFEVNTKGIENKPVKPLSQQIFESRVHLSRYLKEDGSDENFVLANQMLDIVHKQIQHLEKQRTIVKMNLKEVEGFSKRDRWNNLDATDVNIIEQKLSALPHPETVNEMARRFDLMMLKMQIATIMLSLDKKKYEGNLIDIAEGLSKKYTIPAVSRSKSLIENLRLPKFYKGISQQKLNEIREEIRELVQYLDMASKPKIYSDIEDSAVTMISGESSIQVNTGTPYRKRVEAFIRENKQHITISKLKNNVPITKKELDILEDILFDGGDRGNKESYHAEYGDKPLGVFIRSILGLDVEASQKAFADFLQAGNMNANQMTFIQNIISYLSKNGTIAPEMLFDTPPFSNYNGVNGVFDDADTTKIISIVKSINQNAQIG